MCHLIDFAILAKHREKVNIEKRKESKNLDRYLNLYKKLKKLRNMKVTIILFIVVALETIAKNLEETKQLKIKTYEREAEETTNPGLHNIYQLRDTILYTKCDYKIFKKENINPIS